MNTSRHVLSIFFLSLLVLVSCEPTVQEGAVLDEVVIAYVEGASTYSPLNYEAKNRQYLTHIYEPLLAYDTTFNPKTALAVSWGRLDDLTWDFHLREGVWFHNGTAFDASDVVYSLNLAREDAGSGVAALLGNVESVEVVSDHRVQITTDEPDPLLLNKLTNVYIFPDAYTNFDVPVGTGAYRVIEFQEESLVLEAFPKYWGDEPDFEQVVLTVMPGVEQRFAAMKEGRVHVLANVPPQFVTELDLEGMDVRAFPSLEASFLMFNEEGPFADYNLREAVWYALRDDYAAPLGGGYLQDIEQFAATGIFGYQPDIEPRVKDLEKAKALMEGYGEVEVTLDLPIGLDLLGEAIENDLEEIGILVDVNILPPDEFEQKILAGASEFYFFGWKYDLADVADFYESVVHTDDEQFGAFNGMNYSNEQVDELIEASRVILDSAQRRLLLTELTALLLEDKIILPLFESKRLYGFRPEVDWSLRLDGQINASDLKANVSLD